MKLKLIIPAFLMCLLAACQNNDLQVVAVNGTILNSAGDCGWLIQIEDTLYKPTYLNSEYEQDGLEVYMKAEFLNRTDNCDTNPPELIRIEQIRPN